MKRTLLKKTFLTALTLLIAVMAWAQSNPVHFTVSQKQVSDNEIEVVFKGTIAKGWHVYSPEIPADGPIPATLTTEKADGVKAVGKLKAQGKEIKEYDQIFGMQLRYFENSVTFVQRYKITGKTYAVKGYLEYGACNDSGCMPPTAVEFSYKGNGPADAPATTDESVNDTEAATDTAVANVAASTDSASVDTASVIADGDLWKPVINELKAFQDGGTTSHSLFYILVMGFVGGLLAVLMPCIWPIIPMTVSFFLKRNKDKAKGIRDAITYGISIIVIYVLLGFLITLISGGNGLNSLSTNAIFNIIIFLVLVVFAVSFFGWFELELPSKWTNSVDNKASATSGLVSIFLMAFTLVLVSFSCTAPIIGLLLAEFSTSGNIAAPAVGMLGFSVALALPFTLFAMFPAWLKSAPKSGSWMNTLKVTLGFVELAFSLKFLSVADLAYGWHILDRETFLALWIAIFFLLGLYLIGKLKFQSDVMMGESKPMPVPCVMLGLVSFAFSIYMVPGLWGAPCKAVSAFAPPMNTQDFNLNTNEVKPKYTSFEEGMAAAAAQCKPVLVDFTGFGCVNCRKMEAAVWTDPRVADKLNNDYVLISLYVDDKQPLAKPIEVTVNGQKRTLRTVGDKWSYLQQSKFGALAQPYYVTLDASGKPLSRSFSYKEDVQEYLDFLNEGLDNYRK